MGKLTSSSIQMMEFTLLFSLQLKSIQMTAVDLPPFGKNPPVGGADQDTDDEGKLLIKSKNAPKMNFY